MAQGSSNPTQNLTQLLNTNIDVNTGNASAGTQRVVLATNQPVIPVSDNGSSLTVDGTVELGATSLAALENISVTIGANSSINLNQVAGTAIVNGGLAGTIATGGVQAHDAVLASNNPLLVGAYSSTAFPTATSADGDLTRLWANRLGALMVDIPRRASTATVLGALNAAVVLELVGGYTAAMAVTAIATPVGMTLTPQLSFDGGTNWVNTQFDNPTTADKETTIPNATLAAGVSRTIVLAGGATHARIVATAWTSGSVTVQIVASNTHDPSVLFAGGNNSATRPPATAQVGGWDGTNLRALTTNASGHLAIQDGGNSITVDNGGTFAVQAAQSGTWNVGTVTTVTGVTTVSTVTNLSQLGGQAIAMGTGTRSAGTQRVTIATDDIVPVSQSGTWNVGTVTTITTANLAADDTHDGAAGTTGVMLAGYASAATPTAVSADGDAARVWVNRNGAVITDSYSKLTSGTSLGSLNAVASLALGGSKSAGLVVTAIAAPVGMILTPQVSLDGGTNWVNTTFDNPATGDKTATMTNAELAVGASRTIMLAGGITHVRVVATAWTSGSITVVVSGSEARDTSEFFAAANNTTNRPPATAQVGGWDGANLRALSVTNTGAVNIGSIASALPAGTNAIGKLAANSGVDIGDVDVTSVTPGTGATNLGKAVDTAAGAADVGVAVLAVRDDALATVTPADGDYTRLRVTSVGRLWASATIDAALPAGTNSIGTVEIGATSLAALETISAAQSGTWTVQPGNTANTTPWLVRPAESLGTATALGALNAEIVQALNGTAGASAVITATATPTGITLTPYASYDGGSNWVATQFFDVGTALASATLTTFTVGASYVISAGDGATHVKVRATAWTSGSVTVRISATNSQGLVNLKSTAVHDTTAGTYTQLVSGYASSTAPTAVAAGDAARIWTTLNGAVNIADAGGSITVDNGGTFAVQAAQSGAWNVGTLTSITNAVTVSQATASNLQVTATQAAGTAATRWYAQISDGTNSPAIKAASTAAAATDPALVVAISPNNTISVGTHAVTQSGTWTVQPGNTANTTPWLVRPAESLGTATALGALNAEIVQALNGNLGSGVTVTAISAPTGITLTPYASYDGGTNWTQTQFFNSVNGDVIDVLTTFTVGAAYSLSAGDGATHVKVRATAWTSGSVTVRLSSTNSQGLVNLKATATHDTPVGLFVLQQGAYASSTTPTAVANGDAVRLWATTSGALNVADGGGSITVDGTVAATQSGTWNVGTVTTVTGVTTVSTVTNLAQLGGQAITMGTGARAAGTLRVTVATDDIVQTAALPQNTAAYGPTNATTTAYASSLVAKASAGTLYNITGYNSKTSGQFIQLHNATALPANASVPAVIFFVPPQSNFSFDLGMYGRHFTTGIVISNSSTGPTLTVGSADCWFDAQYK